MTVDRETHFLDPAALTRDPRGNIPLSDLGSDGKALLYGDGPPDEDAGELDEFYLDSAAADLYGPKTDDGWGDPVSLIGPPGAFEVEPASGELGEIVGAIEVELPGGGTGFIPVYDQIG